MRYHGEYKVPGGKLVVVDFTVTGGRLCGVQVAGDFFVYPEDARARIDDALEGVGITADEEELAERIRAALGPDVELLGFAARDVAVAVRRALA
jgi:lipoate-protein ligase A